MIEWMIFKALCLFALAFIAGLMGWLDD